MTTHVLANLQKQPLELHLPDRVVVLPPLAHCTLTEAEATAPQLRVLKAARLVRIAVQETAAAQEDPHRADAEEVNHS